MPGAGLLWGQVTGHPAEELLWPLCLCAGEAPSPSAPAAPRGSGLKPPFCVCVCQALPPAGALPPSRGFTAMLLMLGCSCPHCSTAPTVLGTSEPGGLPLFRDGPPWATPGLGVDGTLGMGKERKAVSLASAELRAE